MWLLPHQEQQPGLYFRACAYSQSHLHGLTAGLLVARLGSHLQLRPRKPFARGSGGPRPPHPPEGKEQGPLSVPHRNVGVDKANIPLEDLGETPRASSQPAVPFPRGDCQDSTQVLMSVFCLNFLGPDG